MGLTSNVRETLCAVARVPFQSVDTGGEDEGDGLVAFVEVGACAADGVVAERVTAGTMDYGGWRGGSSGSEGVWLFFFRR